MDAGGLRPQHHVAHRMAQAAAHVVQASLNQPVYCAVAHGENREQRDSVAITQAEDILCQGSDTDLTNDTLTHDGAGGGVTMTHGDLT